MELCLIWSAFEQRQIKAVHFRAWLACKEMAESRSAKFNKRVGASKQWKVRYTFLELAGLMQCSERAARAAVRKLQRLALVSWSETKIEFAARTDAVGERLGQAAWEMYCLMPKAGKKSGRKKLQLPRRITRWLARGESRAVTAVVLAECLRCLFLHKGQGWSTRGRCLASWNAQAFGVGVRSVKRARAQLVQMGWLKQREVSSQHDLQRHGSNFEVDGWFAFTDGERCENDRRAAKLEFNRAHAAGVRVPVSTPPLARGSHHQSAELARPIDNLLLPKNFKNQQPGELASPPRTPDMVFSEELFQKVGQLRVSSDTQHQGCYRTVEGKPFPKLGVWNLETFEKRMKLFEQLASLGWIENSTLKRTEFEGCYRNAVAQSQNPAAMFAWRIQQKKLRYCTDGAEAGVYERVKNHLQPVVRSAMQAVRKKVLPRDGFVVREIVGNIQTGKLRASIWDIPKVLTKHGWSQERAEQAVCAFEQWSGKELIPKEPNPAVGVFGVEFAC